MAANLSLRLKLAWLVYIQNGRSSKNGFVKSLNNKSGIHVLTGDNSPVTEKPEYSLRNDALCAQQSHSGNHVPDAS